MAEPSIPETDDPGGLHGDSIPPSAPPAVPPRIVFLTAGAAGMYCGSCMHDNAVAKAMIAQGMDCLLQPIYTPITTDETSVANENVFFGGIHIYSVQRWPWLSRLPRPIRRLLDLPSLIRLATSRSHSTSPEMFGELTVSMLKGENGRQADEVNRFVDWLANDSKPDAIVLSNLLIGGALPTIRRVLPEVPIAVLLQGDDIFIDHLPQPSRGEVIELLQGLVPSVDYFVTNSQFYSQKMGDLLEIPPEKRVEMPLTIDVAPFQTSQTSGAGEGAVSSESTSPESAFPEPATNGHDQTNEFRLGYLARITPEKGFHRLVDAFIKLAQHDEHSNLHLHCAGWLGAQSQTFFDEQLAKIRRAGLQDRFTHHGSPDLEEKVGFLKSLDLLSVPTDYEDPKGLFVLEALAAGVPVVQPNHGAFGELVERTGGGVTFDPGNLDDLAEKISRLKQDPSWARSLAQTGRQNVLANFSVESFAKSLGRLLLPNSS